jgi:hypothetical protein
MEMIRSAEQAPMLPGAAETAIRAQSKLLGKYRKWHAARMKERRAGPYGAEVGRVLDALKGKAS